VIASKYSGDSHSPRNESSRRIAVLGWLGVLLLGDAGTTTSEGM
jgi:hypothetical protein